MMAGVATARGCRRGKWNDLKRATPSPQRLTSGTLSDRVTVTLRVGRSKCSTIARMIASESTHYLTAID